MKIPNALQLATNTFRPVKLIVYPESRIILSQCEVYLATSLKSNVSYLAINAAIVAVKQNGDLPVPLHLRNAPTKMMKNMDYGKEYKYAHSYENNFTDLEFLPEKLSGTAFYEPQKNGKGRRDKKVFKSEVEREVWVLNPHARCCVNKVTL